MRRYVVAIDHTNKCFRVEDNLTLVGTVPYPEQDERPIDGRNRNVHEFLFLHICLDANEEQLDNEQVKRIINVFNQMMSEDGIL